jgi:branched-chain amino acid transport system permease protein
MGINVDTTISSLPAGRPDGRRRGDHLRALPDRRVVLLGFTAGLLAFTAAVMGGIGNLKGACSAG